MERAWQILQEEPALPEFTPEKTIVYDIPKDEFEITVEDGVFSVKGKRVEKLVNMTDFDDTLSCAGLKEPGNLWAWTSC